MVKHMIRASSSITLGLLGLLLAATASAQGIPQPVDTSPPGMPRTQRPRPTPPPVATDEQEDTVASTAPEASQSEESLDAATVEDVQDIAEDATIEDEGPTEIEDGGGYGERAQSTARPTFAEDLRLSGPKGQWLFGIHGYTRFALRCGDDCRRQPYLADDEYFQSGFQYLRINEKEWAEVFLNAQYDRTRVVVGLFASTFSDWSEVTPATQRGLATAFVEHDFDLLQARLQMQVRAGVFWDRDGYLRHYDTYLFGRKRAGGVRLAARLDDRYYAAVGVGAHAEVPSQRDGFTPVVWGNAGVVLGPVDVGFHAATTKTVPPPDAISAGGRGSLDIFGVETRIAIPHTGSLYLGLSYLNAEAVAFVAEGLEVLHSVGGAKLQQNIFGNQSEDGTGSAFLLGWEFAMNPAMTAAALFGPSAGRMLRGLSLDFFGLGMSLSSKQKSDDPVENRDGRLSVKWGAELEYAPPVLPALFVGLRYDRVIMDLDYDALSFRVLTPRVGFDLVEGVRLFAAYSRYAYGDSIKLRPGQISWEPSRERADGDVVKLQVEASF